jgi:nitrogen fixation/metabolism regulation signal transduction histidine kinase
MSDASSTAARPQYQRSARNYLLDRHFQLKYAGILAGIAGALSIALGIMLWRSSSEIIRQTEQAVTQGKRTVAQGQETVRRHQQTIEQSRIADNIVKMNIVKEYPESPELAKVFQEDTHGKDEKLAAEQERLKREAASLEQQAKELEQQAADLAVQQRTQLRVLVVVLSLLVLCVGLAGIVVTHKVAGPIFKMKRLLRQVGEGKLVVRERLRKGDELQHFFDSFEKMVGDLRARQEAEIAKLDGIIQKLEAVEGERRAPDEGVAQLKELRSQMREQLEA